MVKAALICAFLYWLIQYIETFCCWEAFDRPICVAPIVGFALGDLHTGLIMGAALESIFMGINAIGGTIPSSPSVAATITVAFAILTGQSIEAGLVLALPIGVAASSLGTLIEPFYSSLAPYWEKQAVKGKVNNFLVQNLIYDAIFGRLTRCIIIFLAVAYGVELMDVIINVLPDWVLMGMDTASEMLTAVGFAILTSMIWSLEAAPFFFIGYVLSKFFGLDSLTIAVLGGAIAVTMFLIDKRFVDLKKSNGDSVEGKVKEDFF